MKFPKLDHALAARGQLLDANVSLSVEACLRALWRSIESAGGVPLAGFEAAFDASTRLCDEDVVLRVRIVAEPKDTSE